jgi:hypothetical protein
MAPDEIYELALITVSRWQREKANERKELPTKGERYEIDAM